MSDTEELEGTVKLIKADFGPDMDRRYFDKAVYYTMLDAIEGKTDLKAVGRNVFRPEVRRPTVDDFIMDDKVVLSILDELKQSKSI